MRENIFKPYMIYDLFLVCLAGYIRLSLEGCSDLLLVAEFWDFFRDALLLLTGHEYHQDDLLLSTRDEATVKIIEALEMILGHGNVINGLSDIYRSVV